VEPCRVTGLKLQQDVFRRQAASVNVPPQLSSLGRMNTLASWAEQLAQILLLQEDLGPGWSPVKLAPGMAPSACSISSNYFPELDFRYGIEP
jgi:hypothetical protein